MVSLNSKKIPCEYVIYDGNLSSLNTFISQEKARMIYERPGIIAINNVLRPEVIKGLKTALLNERRYWKQRFNQGLENTSDEFKTSYAKAFKVIHEIAKELFGYVLENKASKSFRPLLTIDEPLHFDTYEVPCGQTSLMAVLNFDFLDRIWHVGPSLEDLISNNTEYFIKTRKSLKPNENLMVRVREDGKKGIGPLADISNIQRIGFTENTLWFANPKTVSHQIVYGGGALFVQWLIEEPDCGCQKCLFEKCGIS